MVGLSFRFVRVKRFTFAIPAQIRFRFQP